MSEFFIRYKFHIVAALLLLTSLQFTSLSLRHRELPAAGGKLVNSVLAPAQKLFHECTQTGFQLWSRYLYLVSVEEERDGLRERLEALEAEHSKISELVSENFRLRKLLNYPISPNGGHVAAAVIGRDPSNWANALTIGQGTDAGVQVGSPVLDGQAVVGQVIAASKSSAKVMLITDQLSAVDALLQNSRASGIAEGTLSSVLRLRYVSREFPVQPGERVVTSGLDGIFPKGVLVGVVTAVSDNPSGLFREVEVQPSADIRRLEMVLVLQPSAGGSPHVGVTTTGVTE